MAMLIPFSCAVAAPVLAFGVGEETLYPPMRPPFVELVREGGVRCVIVPAADTGKAGQWAAQQLQTYLRKMSGAEVPVAERPEAGMISLRLVHDPSLAEEQLRIRCDGKEVVLAGGGDRGVMYAACAFLEECLGVRWFLPTDYGEVVPRSPTVRVGQFDRTEQPDFALRWIGNDADWAAHNRLNVNLPLAGLKVALPGHSFNRILPPEKYFPEHPDWFSYSRKRKARRPTQWCTSNPDLVGEVIENLRAMLDTNPEIRIIGLCPNDGLGFCECDACMALDEPGRPSAVDVNSRYLQMGEERGTALSRRLLIFYNQVARALRETHPHVIVRSFAYNAYLAPPADKSLRCEPNLMVQICHNTCHNHPFGTGNCSLNARFREYLRGWARICEHVGFYEYYAKGAAMGLPWPMVHCIRADIPYLREHGGWGFYTQWDRAYLASAGLNFYVAAKLLWDSRLNVDALLADFFTKFYGLGAEPMRRIFERLGERVARSSLHAKGSSDCQNLFVMEWFAPEVLDPCFADIAEARQRTTDAEVLRRIAVQEAVLTYARVIRHYGEELFRLHREGVSADEQSLRKAMRRTDEVRHFVQAGVEDGLVLREYAQRYLNPVAALKRLRAPIANPW